MAKVGRPSKYSEALADRICEAIALSTKGLNHVCSDYEDFPNAETIRRWVITNVRFRGKYAQARELQMELMASEIVEIAEEEPMMTITFGENSSKTCIDNAGIQRNRLRVDTRKWLMSKLAPKKYGDRLGVDHSGGIEVQLAENIAKARKR